jgi:hypothetical protein
MIDIVAVVFLLVIWGIGKAVSSVGNQSTRVASRPVIDPTAALLNRSQIRAQFDWSDTMIQKYLGEPDKIRTFKRQYGRTGEEHLYLRRRVEAAIRLPNFEPKRVQTRRFRSEPIVVPPPTPEPADKKWTYTTPAPVEPEPDFLRMSIEGQKLRKPPRKRQ